MIITFILRNLMHNLYLIATFCLPSAKFIRHVLTWRCWGTPDQNMVIGRSLPHLCSCSFDLCVCGYILLSCRVFRCLGFWHRTNRWHDFLLPHDLLWLTCWFLLPFISVLLVSMFCCWWISHLLCLCSSCLLP